MEQNLSGEWTKTQRILFRFAFCYFIAYFIFLSQAYYNFLPFLEEYEFHKPFRFISDKFVGPVNCVFFQREFDENIYTGPGDTSWFYIAIFSYFFLASLLTTIWTIFSTRKNYILLFDHLHTFSRFYVAFVLFRYGFGKLLEVQFPDPTPIALMQPVGNIDPHTLLWTFMGASKSYNFFGGLMEIIPAFLLLFRRTAPLGAAIAIATLTNVLLLNFGYDTLVKWLTFHLLLLSFFILSPNLKRLINFFLLNKSTALNIYQPLLANSKLVFVRYILKFILIGYVAFSEIKMFLNINDNSKTNFGNMDGTYEIQEIVWLQSDSVQISRYLINWSKIGINKFGEIAIQYTNDSVIYLSIQIDTISKSINLNAWEDSTFRSQLHYIMINPEEYQFEGTFNQDSIRFTSRKKNLQQYPLIKDKGKVKWVWW